MIGEGERAPRFELPAVVDGAIEPVSLEGQLAGNVVVLAFYPGDFNPACRDGTTGLDDLTLVSVPRNVVVLGISGDSAYSHRAFADQYNLTMPLLSDVTGTVAAEYGVAVESERPTHAARRSVVVVEPSGEVQYAWLADDRDELPDVAEVRAAVEVIDDEATSRARYRVGHAHYVEGRRVFTSAMNAFEDREWLVAERDFERAHGELVEAAERFGTAIRFAESEAAHHEYDHAQEKARTLGQAADWLTGAASEFVRGNSAAAERLRQDAERAIETAHGMAEPIEPDDVGADDDGPDETTSDDDRDESDRIDERELAEIATELEAQSDATQGSLSGDTGESASRPSPETEAEGGTESAGAGETVDATDVEEDLEEEEIELDLTDPTDSADDDEGDDEGDDGGSGDDLGSGGHGVPDSL